MKNRMFFTRIAAFLWVALSVMVSGCYPEVVIDPSHVTELTVANEASSDLHIVFEGVSPPYYGEYRDVTVDVGQGKSVSLIIHESESDVEYHYSPNQSRTKIIISGLIKGEVGETIKEMDSISLDEDAVFFDFLGYRGEYAAMYRFTITDDLLQD